MSYTVVLLPILAALSAAENSFLGLPTKWESKNNLQENLINKYMSHKEELLQKVRPEELKVKASKNVKDINAFLKENNFNIQLDESPHISFATAAILTILLNWAHEGEITTISTNQKEYPAVEMSKEFEVYFCKRHSEPIVKINTKNGDNVYITVADKPREGFDIINFIDAILLQKEPYNYINNYSSVIFPMVDLDQKVDISWLEFMTGVGPKDQAYISQALQQTRFQMNEKGAAAQSAVAISFIKCCLPLTEKLVIDKPFYIWIEREGLSIPLFAAYIDTADWKKPAKLG